MPEFRRKVQKNALVLHINQTRSGVKNAIFDT